MGSLLFLPILASYAMKSISTIGLLFLSNVFMTLAWYGHLKFKEYTWFQKTSLPLIILISWGIALFEYCFQVPANRIGYVGNGGPFNMMQLKVIQEAVSLVVFTLFTVIALPNETFRWNHAVGFGFLVLAVYFIFRK
jgi:uncharacterized protein (DUF486 family)